MFLTNLLTINSHAFLSSILCACTMCVSPRCQQITGAHLGSNFRDVKTYRATRSHFLGLKCSLISSVLSQPIWSCVLTLFLSCPLDITTRFIILVAGELSTLRLWIPNLNCALAWLYYRDYIRFCQSWHFAGDISIGIIRNGGFWLFTPWWKAKQAKVNWIFVLSGTLKQGLCSPLF